MTGYVWSPTDHRPSLVLELVHLPHSGWFCLACSRPWPCPDGATMTAPLPCGNYAAYGNSVRSDVEQHKRWHTCTTKEA